MKTSEPMRKRARSPPVQIEAMTAFNEEKAMYDDDDDDHDHDHGHDGGSGSNPASQVPAVRPQGHGITVNGTRFLIHADQLDHAQLVRLAYPDPAAHGGADSSMTVIYRGGPLAAPDGILGPAERTAIAEGETFVVTRTDKS